MDIFKMECFLRVTATLLLVLVFLLVRFDSQTEVVVIATKATYRVLNAFVVLVGVYAAAAGYSFSQLLRLIFFNYKVDNLVSNQTPAWICFVLDQVIVYLVFATTAAATTASLLAITGSKSFEWMEMCKKYNMFCLQAAIAMAFGFLASIFLAIISFISAFHLFRNYSPKRFFCIQSK